MYCKVGKAQKLHFPISCIEWERSQRLCSLFKITSMWYVRAKRIFTCMGLFFLRSWWKNGSILPLILCQIPTSHSDVGNATFHNERQFLRIAHKCCSRGHNRNSHAAYLSCFARNTDHRIFYRMDPKVTGTDPSASGKCLRSKMPFPLCREFRRLWRHLADKIHFDRRKIPVNRTRVRPSGINYREFWVDKWRNHNIRR